MLLILEYLPQHALYLRTVSRVIRRVKEQLCVIRIIEHELHIPLKLCQLVYVKPYALPLTFRYVAQKLLAQLIFYKSKCINMQFRHALVILYICLGLPCHYDLCALRFELFPQFKRIYEVIQSLAEILDIAFAVSVTGINYHCSPAKRIGRLDCCVVVERTCVRGSTTTDNERNRCRNQKPCNPSRRMFHGLPPRFRHHYICAQIHCQMNGIP